MIAFREAPHEEVIPVLYLACLEAPEIAPRMGSLDLAFERGRQWECYGIYDDDRLIGGVLFRGRVVHVAVLPEYRGRWATRAMYRFLQEQYGRRGPLLAKPAGPVSERFVRRLSPVGKVRGFYVLTPPFREKRHAVVP